MQDLRLERPNYVRSTLRNARFNAFNAKFRKEIAMSFLTPQRYLYLQISYKTLA